MESNIKNMRQEVIQFGKKWDEAMVRNDANEIGSFMSDDWVIVGTEGGITSKTTFLDFIKSGDLLHNKMDFEDTRVEIYDNTAVVTGKGTSSGTYRGEPFSFYEWSTSIYIKNNGHWRCVLTMLTPAK
ncbi:MAG: nuclear transport factor 2 family protein [Fimbriimonadaceae bacterium]|nr:nuclear transport factor 2 family protein [Chitinophagales bacterium]